MLCHESHSPRLNSPNLAPLREPHQSLMASMGFKPWSSGLKTDPRWREMVLFDNVKLCGFPGPWWVLDYREKLYQASLKYTRVPTIGDKGRIMRRMCCFDWKIKQDITGPLKRKYRMYKAKSNKGYINQAGHLTDIENSDVISWKNVIHANSTSQRASFAYQPVCAIIALLHARNAQKIGISES